ncbi:hypothetical protein CEN41_01375 [Fischerella thermalis CCMEE 5330]|uniref:Uncharacterized protein n=1 Tax=Fischerella thermalis CCMEE 5330 TaxID=2019670 RepID=A0A2N6MNP4_9CYAN|nr:hypothetical protein CEN41_01375 [Fischerella thermalis CCMEE 5330]
MNTLRLPLPINETLLLMPTRTLYWERTRTLFAAELRLAGVPSDEAALERLRRAVDHTQPQRIIMLGSWFEARRADLPPLLLVWLEQGRKLHQVGGRVTTLNDLACISYTGGPTPGPHFILWDRPVQPAIGYALAPHNRPALLDGEPVPCFVVGAALGLLPYLSDAPFEHPPYPTPSDDAAVYPISADTLL